MDGACSLDHHLFILCHATTRHFCEAERHGSLVYIYRRRVLYKFPSSPAPVPNELVDQHVPVLLDLRYVQL